MKIAIIDFLAGLVSKNGSKTFAGEELKYSDDIDAKEGTCIIKFTKSGRLYDISGSTANIGSLALLEEKSISIKAIYENLS
jgi:hypothetical protein